MFTGLVRTHRDVCVVTLNALLFLTVSQGLHAQDATASSDVVLKANGVLAAHVRSGSAPTRETRATLIARHERLLEIFRNQPEKARGYALEPGARAALLKAEPAYAALIEQDRPLTGELTSAMADDFVHHTATVHFSLHTVSGDRGLSFVQTRTDLHRFVHHKVTVSGLSLPEIVAAESLREASPAEAQGSAVALPTSSALTADASFTPNVLSTAVSGANVAHGAATALESPLGPQTTAVLILKFAGSTLVYPAGLDQPSFYTKVFAGPAVPNIASFINETSYGQTTVSTDVYGPITIPGDFNCNTVDAMSTAAVTASTGIVDFTKYNHIVFVYPSKGCYFGGLGSTGPSGPSAAIPHQYTFIWLPIEQSYTVTDSFNFIWLATNHEFGHNLGLNHGNSIDFGALSLGPLDFVAVTPGVVTPGGRGPASDSVAGAPQSEVLASVSAAAVPTGSTNITAVNTEYGDEFSNMGNGQGPFNGQHIAQQLGWIDSSSQTDVTTSGSFTIFPEETNAGLRALHVLRDPSSSSWIWVEFHQPIGIYTPLSLTTSPANVANTLLTGAQLHYQNGFGEQLHTLLMDMTPTANPNYFFDGNLAPGTSWSDPFSLLTISAGPQSNTSLGVKVNYDTPCAKVALSAPTILPAGGAGKVTLTAPATCTWSVSSNAPWISFPGTTTGAGNGSVAFNTTANAGITQRNSYITAQRQSLPLVQEGTGITVVGLTPAAATTAPGVSIPLALTLRDGKAVADLSQINVTIAGGTSPSCEIAVVNNGNTNNIDLYLATDGNYSGGVVSGTPGTLTNSSCTIDTGSSSYTASGKMATLTLAVAFPATFKGIHNITASAQGKTDSANVPVGFVNVTNTVSALMSSVAISPASAAPLSGSQGATVPFTITGNHTAFTASSTVQVSGAGVTVSGLKTVNAVTLIGNLIVAPQATKGARAVTIHTGAEVDITSFTVRASLDTPTVTISPSSGVKGTKVPVTITGSNTKFGATSTVDVSGARVKVNNVTYVSPTLLTAEFVLEDDAQSDLRTVTITSRGSEVETAEFTVIPAVLPDVQVVPGSGNQGDFVFVTVTGIDTHFSTATTVGIPGTDIHIRDLSVANSNSLTVKLTIDGAAPAGARKITIRTGAETVSGTFTVTAFGLTLTKISASAATITPAQSVTLTITVAAANGRGVPTGYVSFVDNRDTVFPDILGTVPLSGGKATLPVSHLAVGTHTFSAQYLGDSATFASSVSTANAKVIVQ